MVLTLTSSTVIMSGMPTENAYSLQDLADLSGVSPRTIRYYVVQGLLPSPGQVGPGAHYTDGHLARLRLIGRLKSGHLPLAEIRTRLASLDDETIADLVAAEPPAPPEGSALDYVRAILGGQPTVDRSPADRPAPRGRQATSPSFAPQRSVRHSRRGSRRTRPATDLPVHRPRRLVPAKPGSTDAAPDRSQWDRIALTPDIELHIRRPLSRLQNKRVDRLIAIARELLEENPS